MDDVRIVTVELPPDVAGIVDDAVQIGQFSSVDEVVHAALREWTLNRDAGRREFLALKADVAAGIADMEAGRVVDFDLDRIVEKGRQLLHSRSQSDSR